MSSRNTPKKSLVTSTPFSADDLAGFFTDVATDTAYDPSYITDRINLLSHKIASASHHHTSPPPAVYEYEVIVTS